MGVITPEQLAGQFGLNKNNKPTSRKPGAADLIAPASDSVVPMTEREARSFVDRGINFTPDQYDRAVDIRAERQSFGEDLANSLIRGTIGALGVALEDLSYMSFQPLGEALGVLDAYEKNIFASWGEELKNSGRELFPNYKKHDAGIWNGWDILSDLIENGAGFAIPGFVAGRAAMGAGRLASKGLLWASRSERANGITTLANLIRETGKADAVIANIGGGFLMNHAEGTMMGMETYQDLMSRVGELNGDGEVITEEMAIDAANRVRNVNRALMFTDMIQIGALYKGTKGIRNTIANPKAWKQNIKTAFTTMNADNPIAQSLVEGFEEIAQGVLQREVTEGVTKELGNTYFMDRLGEYLSDESLWYEGTLGFLSGGVQAQGGKMFSNALDIRKANKLKEKITQFSAEVAKETDPKKKAELQLVIDDLENKYYNTTQSGLYENQQKLLIENEAYVSKNLESLAKQQALMESALRNNKDESAGYIANGGFVKLFYDNAARGTVDSLERSLQDLIDQELTKEEREERGLSVDYKQRAQEHLNKIKELEKDYLAASAYVNPAAIYFQTQNLKIKNDFLGGTRTSMNEIHDKLKKDLTSQKVSGVSVEDVLNDRVTKTDDPVKNAKIDEFVAAVKGTPEYEQYVSKRKDEEYALQEIDVLKSKIEKLKSKAYEKEIKDRIAANEQAKQDQKAKDLQAEAQSQKQSEKLKKIEQATGTQQPPKVEVTPEDKPKEPPGSGGAQAEIPFTEETPPVNEEDLPNVGNILDEESKKKTVAKTSEEGDDVQTEDDNFTPNPEDVEETEEGDLSQEQLEEIAQTQFVEGSDTPMSWGGEESVENTEVNNALKEKHNIEEEILVEQPDAESNYRLRQSSEEYQKKISERETAESNNSTVKVSYGSTRAGKAVYDETGAKVGETSDELNTQTLSEEQLRNILDPSVAPAGTEVYFEIDYELGYYNPPGNSRKGLSYGTAQKEGLDYGPYSYFGVPIKILTKDGKLLGYLPPVQSNTRTGIAEGGYDILAATPLGSLRAKIVGSPDTRVTSKVKSRLDGHYFKSFKSTPIASEAIPDSRNVLVKGLNDKLYGNQKDTHEGIDPIALSSFVRGGHTYVILPDGGIAPLFKNKLSTGHVKMLTSAVKVFAKVQSKVPLTDADKKIIDSFKKAGYNITNLNGIQNLLSKYVFLSRVDKAFNLSKEDHGLSLLRPTSSLAKWMINKGLGDKRLITIEANGLAFVNGFKSKDKTVGISISENTPADFIENQKFEKALEDFFTEQFYNTDVGTLGKEDSFVDVFFDENSKQIESLKKPYSQHLMDNSRTNILGHNIGTEAKPMYSYRVNPTITIDTENVSEVKETPTAETSPTINRAETPQQQEALNKLFERTQASTNKKLNTPVQKLSRDEVNKNIKKAAEEHKAAIKELEDPEFLNDDGRDDEWQEKAEELQSKLPQAVSFRVINGKIELYDTQSYREEGFGRTIVKVSVSTLHNQTEKFEVGDLLQVYDGVRSLPAQVTKVNENGKVLEARDDNGVLIITNGNIVGTAPGKERLKIFEQPVKPEVKSESPETILAEKAAYGKLHGGSRVYEPENRQPGKPGDPYYENYTDIRGVNETNPDVTVHGEGFSHEILDRPQVLRYTDNKRGTDFVAVVSKSYVEEAGLSGPDRNGKAWVILPASEVTPAVEKAMLAEADAIAREQFLKEKRVKPEVKSESKPTAETDPKPADWSIDIESTADALKQFVVSKNPELKGKESISEDLKELTKVIRKNWDNWNSVLKAASERIGSNTVPSAELIAEAYHKALKEKSNHELVKAVEDLLGKPKATEQPKAEQPVKPEVKSETESLLDSEERKRYGLEPLRPTYRGASISEWEAVKNGEAFKSKEGFGENPNSATWVSDQKEYSEDYVRSNEDGVLIEFKPEAIDKSTVESGQLNDDTGVRLGYNLTLEDVQRVTDKDGNVIYDATESVKPEDMATRPFRLSLVVNPPVTIDPKKITVDASINTGGQHTVSDPHHKNRTRDLGIFDGSHIPIGPVRNLAGLSAKLFGSKAPDKPSRSIGYNWGDKFLEQGRATATFHPRSGAAFAIMVDLGDVVVSEKQQQAVIDIIKRNGDQWIDQNFINKRQFPDFNADKWRGFVAQLKQDIIDELAGKPEVESERRAPEPAQPESSREELLKDLEERKKRSQKSMSIDVDAMRNETKWTHYKADGTTDNYSTTGIQTAQKELERIFEKERLQIEGIESLKITKVEDLPEHLRGIFTQDLADDALPSPNVGFTKFGEFKSYLMLNNIVNSNGYVTNYAEFQNAAAIWTTRLSKTVSERLGVPVRLMQLATVDANNRIIMNKRSLDFYDLALKGITPKTAYLVKEMGWLKDNQFVQNMTIQRLNELKQHKITCR